MPPLCTKWSKVMSFRSWNVKMVGSTVSVGCVSAGVYVFGLFATDILVNAGQLVTGSLAPHFLSVCRPNYTALGCLDAAQFVSQSDACTGDPGDVMRARKTFPSKEAAVSFYSALYLAVSPWKAASPLSAAPDRESCPFRCTSLPAWASELDA